MAEDHKSTYSSCVPFLAEDLKSTYDQANILCSFLGRGPQKYMTKICLSLPFLASCKAVAEGPTK